MSSINVKKSSSLDIYEENRSFDASQVNPNNIDIENPTIRVANSSNQIPILNPSVTQGIPGDSPELRVDSGYIQWKLSNDTAWTNLIATVDLKGDTGETGATGATGANGANAPNTIFYYSSTGIGNPTTNPTDWFTTYTVGRTYCIISVDNESTWSNVIKIEGIDGDDGKVCFTGDFNGDVASNFATVVGRAAQEGDAVIDINGGTYNFSYYDGSWNLVGKLFGNDGDRGISLVTANVGSSSPSDATLDNIILANVGRTAENGDGILNTFNSDIVLFERTSGSWINRGSLIGTNGVDGEDGSDGDQWSHGSGAPGAGTSSVNYDEYYLDDLTGEIYYSTAGSENFAALPIFTMNGDAYYTTVSYTGTELTSGGVASNSISSYAEGAIATITTGTGYAYSDGQILIVAANENNYFLIKVTDYALGILTGTVVYKVGIGSFNTWYVNLAGAVPYDKGIYVETNGGTTYSRIYSITLGTNLDVTYSAGTGPGGTNELTDLRVLVSGSYGNLISITTGGELEDSGYSSGDIVFLATNQTITGEKEFANETTFSNNIFFTGTFIDINGAHITEMSTDGTFTDNSDTSVCSEKAIKTYVSSVVTGLNWDDNVLDIQEDATLNPVAPNIGDRYIVLDTTTIAGANWVGSYGSIALWLAGEGVQDNDIVEWDGTNFVVNFDASTAVSGITVYDQDSGNNWAFNLTSWINIGSGYTDAKVHDAVDDMIQNGTGTIWTYTGPGNNTGQIDIDTEWLENYFTPVSAGGTFITEGTGIVITYADNGAAAGTLTFELDFTSFDLDDISDGANYVKLSTAKETEYNTAYTHTGIITGNPHNVTLDEVIAVDFTENQGDMWVGSGAGIVELSVGSNNKILIADSTQTGGMRWDTVSSVVLAENNLRWDGNNLHADRLDLVTSTSTPYTIDVTRTHILELTYSSAPTISPTGVLGAGEATLIYLTIYASGGDVDMSSAWGGAFATADNWLNGEQFVGTISDGDIYSFSILTKYSASGNLYEIAYAKKGA